MSYQDLLYEVDDRVAVLTFNRAQRMNALGQTLIAEIKDALAKADADPEVRVIVITGTGGKAFSSGYDLKESAEIPKRTLPEWRKRMGEDLRFTYSPWECSKPVIAMIDGYCLAGALEFAQCCDVRYCSDDSTFGLIEARFSTGIATMIMPWIIGPRCRELIYSGDTFGADEAFRLGLVNRVFPKDQLRAETMKRAKRMSRVSLETLRGDKRAINHTFEVMGLRAAIQYCAETCAIIDATGSPEADTFDNIRREKNVGEALKWRAEQFAPYE
jgi:enoyl-CoA hydratase/carnithine racemase